MKNVIVSIVSVATVLATIAVASSGNSPEQLAGRYRTSGPGSGIPKQRPDKVTQDSGLMEVAGRYRTRGPGAGIIKQRPDKQTLDSGAVDIAGRYRTRGAGSGIG